MLTPKIIDPASLPRRAHFEYFNSFSNPYVGVTVEVDITPLMKQRKSSGAPFFLSLLYHVAQAANAVPELRQRIKDGKILEFPRCPTSHTVAKPDGTYAYCVLESGMPFSEFLPIAMEAQAKCRENGSIEEDDSAIASFFVSSVPWITYTGLVQPTPVPADSNVRISWGKYFQRDGRTFIPMSLLCHHALVDGLHMAHFYEALNKQLAALEA